MLIFDKIYFIKYNNRMSIFICPKCKSELFKKNNSLICRNNHCYDVSAKGYVYLLIHKSTANPGDNKDMVYARKTAMDNGYYDKLIYKIKSIIQEYSPETVLDLACGEGSLTQRLADDKYNMIGIDISKFAITLASKNDKITNYAVASINNVPLKDKSIDLALNCFAPIDPDEIKRILKNEGVLIKVTPYEKHLLELKQTIYPECYLNKIKDIPEGFEPIKSEVVRDKILLKGEYLDAVIKMTPYFYRTPTYTFVLK